MTTRVTAVDARRSLGSLLNIVSIKHEEILIERAGKPIARLSPLDSDAGNNRQGKLDLRMAKGLGKELWRQVNVDRYVKAERDQWT